MIQHPQLNVLCVTSESISILGPLLAYLREIPHVQPVSLENLPKDLSQFHVVITEPVAKFHPDSEQLEQFVQIRGRMAGCS